MKVENLTNARGNKVANQFIITSFDNNGDVKQIDFQSYDSLCCSIVLNCGMGFDCLVRFGKNYNYSATTTKHLYNFLRKYPCTEKLADKKQIEFALKWGYTQYNQAIAVVYDETMK